MHPNAAFRTEDRALMESLIEEVGFGMVFAATPDGPRVAHTPITWTGDGAVHFHLARGNALTKHLDGATALVVINGPEGYVSPRWYADPEQVPTWNYVALELEGRVRRMDSEGLLGLLEALIAREEARVTEGKPWTTAKMPEAKLRAMLPGIVGFELEVQAWRPTFKALAEQVRRGTQPRCRRARTAGLGRHRCAHADAGTMTKLAVFDCDGTLIDGQASICHAMEAAFAEAGLPVPDRNQIRRMVGLSLPQAVRKLVPDIDESLQRDIVDAYKRAFRAQREAGELSQPLFEGISEVLDALHGAGWQLAVATGMSRRGLDHCLATHGLTKHFVSLQTADDNPSKPHPAMLEAALFEADADAAEAVMIGDTVYDIQMARDAGVRAIGVDWGYHAPEELTAAGAEFVATSPAALKEYLLR